MVSDDNPATESTSRRTYLRTAGTAVGALALASGTAVAGDDKGDGVEGVTTEDDPDLNEVEEERDPTEIDEPTVITEAGNYRLTDDIEVTSGSGIRIITDNVSLDGNGYTISGDGESAGIVVFGDVLRNILIRDVTVKDFRSGFVIQELFDSTLNNVTVKRCPGRGISLLDSAQNTIIDSELIESGLFFGTDATDNTVRNNTITDAPNNGIRLNDAVRNIIALNNVSGSEESGFSTNDSRNLITQNKFTDNQQFGVDIQVRGDNIITDNNLSDNNEGPCNVDTRCDNEIRGNDPECESTD